MSRLVEVKGLHADLRLPAGMLHAVRNVSFSMDHGETLSLVGESGCGKSMTALAIMDLLPPRGIRRADKLVFEGQDLMTAGAAASSAPATVHCSTCPGASTRVSRLQPTWSCHPTPSKVTRWW